MKTSSPYLKAIVAGLGAALAAGAGAALDGSISLVDAFVIAGALVGGFQAVYWTPNAP